jgi:uncharacterized repeat protein (TIGR01451 family)
MPNRALALTVFILMSVATCAFAATAPTGVHERLRAGQAVELIVEFQADTVDQEATRMRSARGRHSDDDSILAMRAERYAGIRDKVGAALVGQEIDALRDYSHLPMGFRRFRSAAALSAFLARPEVKAVYENRALHVVLAQSLPLIGQPTVAAVGEKGAGTTVAVIDDGIDYTLSAFGNCTAPGSPTSCRVIYSHDFGTGTTDTSHGTNVSAVVVGVAPETRIAMLNAFSGTTASSSDIISAINWAITNRSTYNIAAINMSLGDGAKYTSTCTGGNPFATPITNAISAGMMVVVASGNEKFTDGISSPACSPGAISVGAAYDANVGTVTFPGLCSDSTTAADKVTCFSNSSSLLTMLAPGGAITAAGITMYGTSQATPHVAGAVAVLRAAFPGESLTATKTRLTSTGVAVTDSRNSLVKPRLNLLEAARPANDAFASRVTVAGSGGSATGTSLLATEEAGEPVHGGSGGAHSVWWKWTAPAAGQVTLATAGSGFDTLLAVYTGSAVAALTSVASNDNTSGATTASSLLFEAQSGTQYQIAVDGASGGAGAVSLNWSLNTSAKANLSVGVTGPTTGVPGTNSTYVVTAANAGPQSATNVVVTITLPTSASFVSASAACTATGNQVVCSAGTVASGGTASFEIVALWNAIDPAATVSTSVTSDLPDSSVADNTATFYVAVAPDSGDVPTLPEWAVLLLGMLLLGALARTRQERG